MKEFINRLFISLVAAAVVAGMVCGGIYLIGVAATWDWRIHDEALKIVLRGIFVVLTIIFTFVGMSDTYAENYQHELDEQEVAALIKVNEIITKMNALPPIESKPPEVQEKRSPPPKRNINLND